MLNLLRSLLDIVVNLVNLVISTINSLINLFSQLPAYISFISANMTILPSIILPFALASISIYVIFLVLGRN